MYAIVVNDSRSQLNLLRELLQRTGLRVKAFSRADDALAYMMNGAVNVEQGTAGDDRGLPEIIVTDLYMPGIDGWRFCRLLRSDAYAALNQIPIVVVSATFAGEYPEEIAADLGADLFIPAPVDGGGFVDRIKALLEGKDSRQRQHVLVAESDHANALRLSEAFDAYGYQVSLVESRDVLLQELVHGRYVLAVVAADFDADGHCLIQKVVAASDSCVVVALSPVNGEMSALDLLRQGVAAYVQRPYDPEYVVETGVRARREQMLLRVEALLDQRTLELRREGERFKIIAENTSDGILVLTGDDHHVEYVSPAYYRQRGYERVEDIDLTADGIYDRIHPEDRDEIFTRIYRAIEEQKRELKYAYRARHRTGFFVWYEDYARLCYDEQGRYMASYVVSRDITERKEAEASLLESEARNNALLSALPDMMFLIGYDGCFQDCHCADQDQLLVPVSKIIGRRVEEILPPDIARLTRDKIADIIRDGHTAPYRYRIEIPDRGEHYYESRMVPCGVGSVMAIVRDISDIHVAEQEHERLHAQLLQAQKMESVGRLAGGVAHDFNNMLLVILGQSEIALDELSHEDPLYDSLVEIRHAAERSAALTRQLLAFARKQTILPQVLDLNETVEGMLKMLRRLIGEDIRLRWIPGEGLANVNMDPSQIDQLMANLCVNAKDAIGGVGNVTIETRRMLVDDAFCKTHPGAMPGAYVMLKVTDDGCGMDDLSACTGLGCGAGAG